MKTQLQLFPLNLRSNFRFLILSLVTVCLSVPGVARAQTVVWSETFADGNGNSRWYADEGVWQIGSPTIGPETNSAGDRTYPAYADATLCPYCATTGLTGNYPSGMDSRLIRIQTFTVPPANLFPRLRFWHWYSFACAFYGCDYGVVEIQVGNSGWQAVSPNYTEYCGDWTYASIDLSAFAGETVQLAFHAVYINGQNATNPGWYVDDIALEEGTPVFNNPEGWTNGIGDWYAEQGTWQVGSPTKSSGPATNSLGAQAYEGTNCAVTLLNSDYQAGMNSRLISPYFVLPPPSSSPYLRFWHWYSFACAFYGCDYGLVEIQVGTNDWQAVSPQYTEYSGSWTEPFVDLTSFGGQTVRLAFEAVYVNGQGAVNSGWYVDNIQVYPYAASASNPYINISMDSTGTNVVMNWTSLANYADYTLQSITNPVSQTTWNTQTNWNTVSTAPVVVNGQNVVTNPVSGASQFYRLVLPQ
ncbi:MAG TPA: choice-of-anchor J domain-containing protein [Candidatus Baltobacteraceae bacterium]|jgi:hypothetical protein|nr:choice-of-anchor J domain-containing protein [Candidatus Baltobacteraceae bacterium]